MTRKIDIAGLTSIDKETLDLIRQGAQALFTADDTQRAQVIEQIIEFTMCQRSEDDYDQTMTEHSVVFFDMVLTYLINIRSSHPSELYNFFTILNHLPILHNSPFYSKTIEVLSRDFLSEPETVKVFDQLQMLNLFIEIGNLTDAALLAEDLEAKISPSCLRLYTMYQLCLFKIYTAKGQSEQRMGLLLKLMTDVYCHDGAPSAIYIILRWIASVKWLKSSVLLKALYMKLYEELGHHRNLNAALVIYELFCLDDRLVSPTEKMGYYKRLIKLPSILLNANQLHNLHFFAGNYSSGLQAKFQDSIQSFQYSNYFLHKCWERLIGISKYLRTHLSPAKYLRCMSYMEGLLLNLSHESSLQSNSYVENLQNNYETIEDLYKKVGELSLTDGLTGLRNRRYMDNNLTQFVALASRHKVPVCFAMIDIDLFKIVNDTYGHAAGDYVLKELASLLTSEFRISDIIIRYGGEEFLIVLFDLDMQRGMEMMEELRIKISTHPFEYKGHPMEITVSIGITCEHGLVEIHASSLQKYINAADQALYLAKNSGRNTIRMLDAFANHA